MMRPRVFVFSSLVGASLLLASPSIALATYAPALSVTFQPPTAATAPAVIETLTNQPGDTPSKTIRIHYPPQFGFNPNFGVTGCPPAAEHSDSCPADSQIGSASAETTLGHFSGPVYFTPDYRILIYLRGVAGVVQSKFVGYFQDAPDGGFDAVLDNLPDVPSSSSSIRIEGGARSSLLTPAACGSYPIVGHFTSQNGEQATSTATVQISGCDSQPTIERAWLTRSTLIVTGSHGAASDALHWTLSDVGARATVSLQRLKVIRGMEVPRTLWSRPASAQTGTNSLRFRAAAGGHPLHPGHYRLTVAVFSLQGHPSDLISADLTVIGPGQSGASSGCIKRGSDAGDADADNRGGPSDGDGCI